MLLFILVLALSGLIVGGLARLAVPGPDPMSVWMTMGIGVVGSLGGGLVSHLFFGGYFSFLLSLVVAVLLVIGHRRLQGRDVSGPGARRRPGAP